MIFSFFFFKFIFSPSQIQRFGQNSCLVEDYSRNISEKHLSKYLQWDKIKAYYLISHCKSMETIGCHSDENTWATAIKNTAFVEANVINISTKFQLHPPYGFWGEDFIIFFANLAFWLPWQPIKFSSLDKTQMACRGILINISVNFLSKYLQRDSNKCQFLLFPLEVNGNYKLP